MTEGPGIILRRDSTSKSMVRQVSFVQVPYKYNCIFGQNPRSDILASTIPEICWINLEHALFSFAHTYDALEIRNSSTSTFKVERLDSSQGSSTRHWDRSQSYTLSTGLWRLCMGEGLDFALHVSGSSPVPSDSYHPCVADAGTGLSVKPRNQRTQEPCAPSTEQDAQAADVKRTPQKLRESGKLETPSASPQKPKGSRGIATPNAILEESKKNNRTEPVTASSREPDQGPDSGEADASLRRSVQDLDSEEPDIRPCEPTVQESDSEDSEASPRKQTGKWSYGTARKTLAQHI